MNQLLHLFFFLSCVGFFVVTALIHPSIVVLAPIAPPTPLLMSPLLRLRGVLCFVCGVLCGVWCVVCGVCCMRVLCIMQSKKHKECFRATREMKALHKQVVHYRSEERTQQYISQLSAGKSRGLHGLGQVSWSISVCHGPSRS